MPKSPPPTTASAATSWPIVRTETVSGAAGDPRVPCGLQGVFTLALLASGRWIIPGLPPAIFARYYPDLVPLAEAVPDLPPPPSVAEV